MRRRSWLVCAVVLTAACAEEAPRPSAADPESSAAGAGPSSCEAPEAGRVVEALGSRMRGVSLLAPPAGVERQLRSEYDSLVTSELLEAWIRDPATAPGRDVSSPWPERIVIDSTTPGAKGACTVYGRVIHATSTGTVPGGTPIVATVELSVSARISALYVADAESQSSGEDTTARVAPEPSALDAVRVVRRYYEAIEAKRYDEAYALWSDGGNASGQSRDAFAAGFSDTEAVSVTTGVPDGIGAAAGSRYVEIPVTITARTAAGETRHFSGVYTLRRSVVDGATAAQREWRIYDAEIRQH